MMFTALTTRTDEWRPVVRPWLRTAGIREGMSYYSWNLPTSYLPETLWGGHHAQRVPGQLKNRKCNAAQSAAWYWENEHQEQIW